MIIINKKIGQVRVSFTPSFYKTAYQNYENGYYREIIAMMKRATIDSQVAGCLLGRKAGFQREFSLTPYDSDNQKDQENTTWVANMIGQLNMRQLFKAIHEAVLFRYSVIDPVWEIIDNRQVVTGFNKIDQKYFRYKDDELKIDFGKDLRDIPDDALVCESHETPVMLPVLRDYILKEFGLESWAGFIETFGEGIIIGKYPPGADNEIKAALEQAVTDIAGASRGIMPDNTEIDVKGYESRIGSHDKFIDAADKGISISILGHENAVAQSKGLQVGENISSYKVKREIAVDDMYFIDEQMNKFLRNIWDRNFGDGRYPIFALDKSEPINISERLEVLDQYYRQGGKIDPAHYSELGIRVMDDQEPLQVKDGLLG